MMKFKLNKVDADLNVIEKELDVKMVNTYGLQKKMIYYVGFLNFQVI